MAVTGPAELAEALLERETAAEAEKPRQGGRRAGNHDRGVALRALDGGLPGR
jgi:hypothetical protein